MKKTQKISSILTFLTIALMSFGPTLVSADSLHLNIGVSGKAQVSDDDKNGVVRANVNTNSRIIASENNEKSGENKNYNNREGDNKQLPRGIAKKIDDDKSNSNWEWFGWFKRWFNHSTTTVDTLLPIIRNIESVVTSTTTATITWNTNEKTSGEVKFSSVTPIDTNSSVVVDSSVSTNHTINLTNLNSDTKYYFTITAKDSTGNVKTTDVMQFKTKAVSSVDITSPRVLFSTALETSSSSTHLIWVTDERSDSRVWVSTSNPADLSVATTVSLSNKVYIHDIVVKNLTANTTYFYGVKSADSSGNLSSGATGSFTTTAN